MRSATRLSVRNRMKKRRRRRIRRLLGGAILIALILGVTGALFIYWLAPVSSLGDSIAYEPLHSRHTRTTGLRAEGFTPLSEISPYVLLGVLACEDRRFASHGGFDFSEAGVAIADAVLRERKLRGASTISQQLVRNVFLDDRRSLWRKLREAVYTLKLEQSFSKQEILALYLDVAQLGVGVYGVRDASTRYFQKPPKALDMEEAALLATLLPDPEVRSKWLTLRSTRSSNLGVLNRRLFKIHKVLDYLAQERAGQPLNTASILRLPLSAIIDRELDRVSEARISRATSESLRTILSRYFGKAVFGSRRPRS